MQKTEKDWGFDTKNIDKSVRPQDDFYNYANGGWLKKNKIPADESRWGSFIILRYETEHQLKALVEGLLGKKHAPRTPEQQIADLYASAMDMKRRNALGTEPIEKERADIRALQSPADIIKYAARVHRVGGSALFVCAVDQDLTDSTHYLLQLWQGGLGLPDRDYYLLDKPEQKRVRAAYTKHVERMLRLAGMNAKEAVRAREAVMKVETLLAKASMNNVDARDVDKTFRKVKIQQLAKEVPSIDWSVYFKLYGADHAKEVNLAQPKFFAALAKMLRTVPLEEWKQYLEWHLISDTSGLLSEAFVKANFEFAGRTIMGMKKMKPLWRRSLAVVNGALGEAGGKLYVEKHFPPEAKRAMHVLVDDLFAAYEERMKKLDWMSSATKKKAIAKLHATGRKIGYPDRWRSYKTLEVRADDYFGNVVRAAEFEHKRAMRRLNKPVDRKEWVTVPQIVNAFNHFNMNDITFPAAILQPPFFSLSADAAVNYAAIGSVIGHELSHSFDDQGSKIDGKGNRHEWWTASDKKKFVQKSKLLADQYDKYEAADGVMVNGKLTLGENIADLGGLAIAYDAYQKHLHKTGRHDIGGWTPEQRFFFGFAQQERELARPEFMKMAALVDPHSPHYTRVNGPLSNFEPFYEAFGVKKGDKLYREPKHRAKIW